LYSVAVELVVVEVLEDVGMSLEEEENLLSIGNGAAMSVMMLAGI